MLLRERHDRQEELDRIRSELALTLTHSLALTLTQSLTRTLALALTLALPLHTHQVGARGSQATGAGVHQAAEGAREANQGLAGAVRAGGGRAPGAIDEAGERAEQLRQGSQDT